jgi:hypothetical protein
MNRLEVLSKYWPKSRCRLLCAQFLLEGEGVTPKWAIVASEMPLDDAPALNILPFPFFVLCLND